MYPIPASRSLMLYEIADHWSREIEPRRTKEELIRDLGQALWRGEFTPTVGPTRLKLLISLFRTSRATLVFWVKGKRRPKTLWLQADKSALLLELSVLPIPNKSPKTWTDEQCVEAYEAIAQDWGHDVFVDVAPIVSSCALTEAIFTEWVETKGYNRPKFWASVHFVTAEPASAPVPPMPKKLIGTTQELVEKYIARSKATGKLPTKVGLEATARIEGRKGRRDQLRTEFNRQMGGDAPVRGRPTK